MANVKEDRLFDCILNELLSAVGCATLGAVPGALLALSFGFSSGLGVAFGGLLAYAMLTAADVYERAALAAKQDATIGALRRQVAEAGLPTFDAATGAAEPGPMAGRLREISPA